MCLSKETVGEEWGKKPQFDGGNLYDMNLDLHLQLQETSSYVPLVE